MHDFTFLRGLMRSRPIIDPIEIGREKIINDSFLTDTYNS